ncbi:MAG: ferrous iron transporter B [Spirochaetes bacterium]|nr:ferrous iron transporter B [Spirochaetota bacterium]
MSCHNVQADSQVLKKPNKILLMGNPNVGKSVFFTELTGIHAMSSNYAGTTVSFMEGRLALGETEYTLIDVPGTYSLSATSEAEAVAARFMESGAKAVICVLDASNLERNLLLALEMRPYNVPTVYALNLIDVAERQGINVNAKVLAQELGGPVVETVAVKSKGFAELADKLKALLDGGEGGSGGVPVGVPGGVPTGKSTCASCGKCHYCRHSEQNGNYDLWATAREIARRSSAKNTVAESFADRLGEYMIRPFPGIPIAALAMALTIGVVMGGGRALRAFLLLPLVNDLIVPFFRGIFGGFLPEGVFLNILVGEFGIFVISFEWILALIFPYVLMFYVAFTYLEDTGYLPRISVLFDSIMRKLGVQGGSLLHMVMGYGCAVPAIIGSRAATSRKERIVITAAICFAVPCISQTGALIALLSGFGWWMMPSMILFSLLLFVSVTLVAGKVAKGTVEPLLLEVPKLLIPTSRAYGRKLAARMKHFLKDAEVPMMAAIVIAALLAESGLLAMIALYAQPLVSGWLGMPAEAVTALILGIVRREMSVAPLLALDLTSLQAFVGGAVSLMYLPCLSVFAILAKEFNIRIALTITLSTIALAFTAGGLINHAVRLFL